MITSHWILVMEFVYYVLYKHFNHSQLHWFPFLLSFVYDKLSITFVLWKCVIITKVWINSDYPSIIRIKGLGAEIVSPREHKTYRQTISAGSCGYLLMVPAWAREQDAVCHSLLFWLMSISKKVTEGGSRTSIRRYQYHNQY